MGVVNCADNMGDKNLAIPETGFDVMCMCW